MAELGAERSHASVLAAARERIRADAAARGLSRTVVIAHALVTGARPRIPSETSGWAASPTPPARALAGCCYLALGHLHGQQRVSAPAAPPPPGTRVAARLLLLERHHHKSVTLAEIGGDGIGGDRAAARAGAPAAAGGARPPRRPARPGRTDLADLVRRLGRRRCSPTGPGPWRRWSGCARNGRTPSPWTSARGRADRRPTPTWRGWPRRRTRSRSAGCSWTSWRGPRPTSAQLAVLRQAVEAAQRRRGGRLMRLHTLELQAFGPTPPGSGSTSTGWPPAACSCSKGPPGRARARSWTRSRSRSTAGWPGRSPARTGSGPTSADPAAEPSVTLEFSLHGARYRVTRVPEHRRPKKRGEGFTTEASRVHLERLEAGGWSSLTSNKAEAGEMITEAVGLSREQFTQVMLLPQGSSPGSCGPVTTTGGTCSPSCSAPSCTTG
mgnify:CR=1 FL=1